MHDYTTGINCYNVFRLLLRKHPHFFKCVASESDLAVFTASEKLNSKYYKTKLMSHATHNAVMVKDIIFLDKVY